VSLKRSFRSIQSGPSWGSFAVLALMLVGTTGFTSCATDTGVWTGPALEIIPSEVLLRASQTSPLAVGLARVEGGDPDDRYRSTLEYTDSGVEGWLTVEASGPGRDLTLRAVADGLSPGVHSATVSVTGESSGGRASLRVEFNVVE